VLNVAAGLQMPLYISKDAGAADDVCRNTFINGNNLMRSTDVYWQYDKPADIHFTLSF
jgi:hypothetical protein